MQHRAHSGKSKKKYFFSQNQIISAFREYQRLHQGIASLNEEGICGALSIAFAFSHLVKPQDDLLTPELFQDLLHQLQSLHHIESFFQRLEDLTERYQKTMSLEEKERALKELQPMWAQLAVIDFALLLYNTNKTYPTFLKAHMSDMTLGFMGLKSVAKTTLRVPATQLHHIFFRLFLSRNNTSLAL